MRRCSDAQVSPRDVDTERVGCVARSQLDIDFTVGTKVGRDARKAKGSIAAGAGYTNAADGGWVDDLGIIETESQLSWGNGSDRTIVDQFAIVGLHTDEDRSSGYLGIGL